MVTEIWLGWGASVIHDEATAIAAAIFPAAAKSKTTRGWNDE
jgi:hypothetical protein